MKKIIIIVFVIILNSISIFAFIDVLNLGTINYKNKMSGQNKVETENLNYYQVKSKIISVLKANKINYKVRTGLIESKWYNYKDKTSKLFITILADESYIRIQLHQKKKDETIKYKFDPYKIKSEIEKVLK